MRIPKYRNQIVEVDGIRFASRLEARRYQQLKLLERAGEISELKLQEEFVIDRGYISYQTGQKMRAVVYVADFSYNDHRTKQHVIEDVKGVETAQFRNKWRMCQERYPQYDWRIVTQKDMR